MKGLVLAATIASLTQPLDRRDLDEVARQGELAGPVVVEKALASSHRNQVLAGIAAASSVEDAAELLPTLAIVAANPDRRSAVPAARAALSIARHLASQEVPDNLATDDIARWSSEWLAIALDRGHFIEARVLALDVASTLAHAIDPAQPGYDLTPLLADSDPAIRATAVALIPRPTSATLRAQLVSVVISDADPHVALAAAQVLCADLIADDPKPIVAALGDSGISRIRTLIAEHGSKAMILDAARCLVATHSITIQHAHHAADR